MNRDEELVAPKQVNRLDYSTLKGVSYSRELPSLVDQFEVSCEDYQSAWISLSSQKQELEKCEPPEDENLGDTVPMGGNRIHATKAEFIGHGAFEA